MRLDVLIGVQYNIDWDFVGRGVGSCRLSQGGCGAGIMLQALTWRFPHPKPAAANLRLVKTPPACDNPQSFAHQDAKTDS